MYTNRRSISLFAFLLLVGGFAQSATAQTRSATLYSPNKYRNLQLDFCVDFKVGATSDRFGKCDLRYGNLYAGDDLDWFQSSASGDSRSVMKDLGSLTWESEFKVPVVTPLPQLLPGEIRKITVDVSGADGADGAPGLPGADADGVVREERDFLPPKPPAPAKKKHDGKPKIDPVFVKAIVGHMYVIRVVDEVNDFYALVRVDAIERGDHCKISWKIIDSPEAASRDN